MSVKMRMGMWNAVGWLVADEEWEVSGGRKMEVWFGLMRVEWCGVEKMEMGFSVGE